MKIRAVPRHWLYYGSAIIRRVILGASPAIQVTLAAYSHSA